MMVEPFARFKSGGPLSGDGEDGACVCQPQTHVRTAPLAGENLVPIALQGVRSFAMKFWLPAPVRSWRRRLSQSWSCGTPSKDGCVSFSAYRRGPLTLRCVGESEVKCLPTVLTN
jgi:hypothetical protein